MKHKKVCKQRAAELRDEALFKNPPPKEDCPICFLPMPVSLICCMSLPPASVLSVPIYDYAMANEELAKKATETYYPCCGKCICTGCIYSFRESGNDDKCPFCNSNRGNKTDEECIQELMKRVEAGDASAIYQLASYYYHGIEGFQQDHAKSTELYARAANLGSSEAHYNLGNAYRERGDLKKAKIHTESAAMAGHEVARYNLGITEARSGNLERAVKHWTIGASAGEYQSMHILRAEFEKDRVSRDQIDSILAAYNDSCAEMRSEARDAFIKKAIIRNRRAR
jgi:TPR repeat protein